MNQKTKGRGLGQGMGQGNGPSVRGNQGRGQGMGSVMRQGRGYGRNQNNFMDFSNTEDLSQLIHGCSHYLKQSQNNDLGGTQYKILEILKDNGHMTQRYLMELLHVKAGSLSEIVKKLEMKGLIEKLPNPEDRRSILISITAAGEDQIEKCDGECEGAFGALDDEEKESLKHILKKLLDDWYN